MATMIRAATTSPPATPVKGPSPLVVRRVLGTVVVALYGEFDGSTSKYLGAVLGDLIDGQGNQAVVIDLADLRRLDRLATDALAAAADTISRQGGCLALRRPSAAVNDVLAAAGLDELVIDPSNRLERRCLAPSDPASPIALRRVPPGQRHRYDPNAETGKRLDQAATAARRARPEPLARQPHARLLA